MEDAGVSMRDIGFLACSGTVRCGYEGYVAGAVLARTLGLRDVDALTVYGACTSGAQALAAARDRVLTGKCHTALVIGADIARAPDPSGGANPGAVRLGAADSEPLASNLPYLGIRARRRMHDCGTTEEDLHQVRAKNTWHGSSNIYARFRSSLSQQDIEMSPMIADPLRLLHVSTYSDGAAAVVIGRREDGGSRPGSRVMLRAISLSTMPDEYPEMPYRYARASSGTSVNPRAANVARTLEEAAISSADLSLVELYDISSVAELDWYEHIGLCEPGDAEKLLRSGATRLGGRIPVNVSGGLASFGEAVAAQALAQVCELTWQLRGQCGARQVEGARIALAVSDGMYGHVASIVLGN